MIGKIGDQDGITAASKALATLDKPHAAAYGKLEATLRALKTGHNEGVDFRAATTKRVDALEVAVSNLPFLRAPGSSAPGD